MTAHKSVDRRTFLKQTAAAGLALGASTLPFSARAQPQQIAMREIPGTGEYLPVVGLGGPDIFDTHPAEGSGLAKSLIQTLLDQGGKMIDTPAFFRPHDPVIGEILDDMDNKNQLFLNSKITVEGKQEGIDHVERVLANLDKTPLDLLLVHNMRDLENNWATLKDYKEQGRVRYIGVSLSRHTDFSPLEEFMTKEKPDFVMTGYSITQQGAAEQVLPIAADLGIAMIGIEAFKAFEDGAYFDIVSGVELPEWTAEFGCESWAQFSLKWILGHPAMTTVVVETSKTHHVVDNMRAGLGDLPDQAMRTKMSEFLLSLS